MTKNSNFILSKPNILRGSRRRRFYDHVKNIIFDEYKKQNIVRYNVIKAIKEHEEARSEKFIFQAYEDSIKFDNRSIKLIDSKFKGVISLGIDVSIDLYEKRNSLRDDFLFKLKLRYGNDALILFDLTHYLENSIIEQNENSIIFDKISCNFTNENDEIIIIKQSTKWQYIQTMNGPKMKLYRNR